MNFNLSKYILKMFSNSSDAQQLAYSWFSHGINRIIHGILVLDIVAQRNCSDCNKYVFHTIKTQSSPKCYYYSAHFISGHEGDTHWGIAETSKYEPRGFPLGWGTLPDPSL